MGKVLLADSARELELKRMMQAYGPLLAGMCTALLKDADLAQDVVQETFVRAWRKLDDLHGGQGSEKAWLCRIAINLCRDQQRSRWFRWVDRRTTPEELPLSAQAPGEEASALAEVLGLLASRHREIILLHYYQNMNAEEIGHVLGLSESAVYRRLGKARRQLRLLLEGGEGNE